MAANDNPEDRIDDLLAGDSEPQEDDAQPTQAVQPPPLVSDLVLEDELGKLEVLRAGATPVLTTIRYALQTLLRDGRLNTNPLTLDDEKRQALADQLDDLGELHVGVSFDDDIFETARHEPLEKRKVSISIIVGDVTNLEERKCINVRKSEDIEVFLAAINSSQNLDEFLQYGVQEIIAYNLKRYGAVEDDNDSKRGMHEGFILKAQEFQRYYADNPAGPGFEDKVLFR